MPTTDLMELSTPEIKKEFDDLFAFAKKEGAMSETGRPHFAQRFARDPFSTRQEIDQLIAGAKFRDFGLDAVHLVVHDLPGYPKVEATTGTEYPSSWVPQACA